MFQLILSNLKPHVFINKNGMILHKNEECLTDQEI